MRLGAARYIGAQLSSRSFPMKKTHVLCSLALGALAALPAGAQTIITASTWLQPTHAMSLAQKEWCDLLEKNTSGKMKCNILPRAVANPPGTYDAVKNGLAGISFTVHSHIPRRFLLTQIVELPVLGDASAPLSVAFAKVALKQPHLERQHQGVHFSSTFTYGPGMLMNTKKQVTKMDDLQCLNWSLGGGMVNDMTKMLAMNAPLKPATEIYERLTGGVMDGTLLPAE